MEEKPMEETRTDENPAEEKPVEEKPVEERPVAKKPRRGWLVPAILAGVAAVAVIGVAAFFLTRPAIPDPYAAACEALDDLPPLGSPAALGVLGQGEVDGARFGVSGNLNLQADGSGLALSLTDFTLANEEGATDLEVYINKDCAAVRLPGLTGETWYGIDFLEGLKVQAAKVIDEELVDWYFTAEQLEEAQGAIDGLRAALGEVYGLDFSDVIGELKESLRYASATVEKAEDGFVLTFDKLADQGAITSPAVLRLDAGKRLVSLEITYRQVGCLLDLGDRSEPSPRLELEWGEDRENSLELAFTISAGLPLTPPQFENAFALLAPVV